MAKKANPWNVFRNKYKGILTPKQMKESYNSLQNSGVFKENVDSNKEIAEKIEKNKKKVLDEILEKGKNKDIEKIQSRAKQIVTSKANKGKPVEVKKAGKNKGKLKITEINKSFDKLKIPKNLQGTGYNDTLRKLKAKKSSLKSNQAIDKYDAIICAFENMWKSRKTK